MKSPYLYPKAPACIKKPLPVSKSPYRYPKAPTAPTCIKKPLRVSKSPDLWKGLAPTCASRAAAAARVCGGLALAAAAARMGG
eukprot:scaffold17284_cov90-Isochrysis_galbana.AAC.2